MTYMITAHPSIHKTIVVRIRTKFKNIRWLRAANCCTTYLAYLDRRFNRKIQRKLRRELVRRLKEKRR